MKMAEDIMKTIADHMGKMLSISNDMTFYSNAYLERNAELARYNELLHGGPDAGGSGNVYANLNAIHRLLIFKKKHDFDKAFVCDTDCRNYPNSCDICKRNQRYFDMLVIKDPKEK